MEKLVFLETIRGPYLSFSLSWWYCSYYSWFSWCLKQKEFLWKNWPKNWAQEKRNKSSILFVKHSRKLTLNRISPSVLKILTSNLLILKQIEHYGKWFIYKHQFPGRLFTYYGDRIGYYIDCHSGMYYFGVSWRFRNAWNRMIQTHYNLKIWSLLLGGFLMHQYSQTTIYRIFTTLNSVFTTNKFLLQ